MANKSAYQLNLQQSSEPSRQTTTRDVLKQISILGQRDKTRADEYMKKLSYSMQDASSKYYNPYTQATNKAVSALASYGFDMSVVDDNWFNQNSWLKQYYVSTANTNGLSSTMNNKRASKEQKAAYQYNQLWQAEETTKKAEQEWAALQEELNYWANRTDRNYSDDEIIGRINWNNYKTLQKMDDGRLKGQPIELNRAIGYSDDAMYGVLYAARNGSTGNYWEDIANSANGTGWKDNPEIRAKLDIGNLETYSPYSVGSTMEDEGMYFSRDTFDQKWLDDNRALYLGGNDETAKKMYQNVYEAEQYTQKLEQQLSTLMSDVNALTSQFDDPDQILNALRHGTSDYSDLFDLDESLKSGKLKDTTRAIDYRWQDIEKKVRDACEKKASRTTTDGLVKWTTGSESNSEAVSELKSYYKANVNESMPTINEKGTNTEKTAALTGKAEDFDAAQDTLANANVEPSKAAEDVTKRASDEYLSYVGVTYDFEQHQSTLESLNADKAKNDERLKALRERKAAANAVAGATKEQVERILELSEMPSGQDADWDWARVTLSNPNSDPYDVEGALNILYQDVTGNSLSMYSPDVVTGEIEKAKKWFDYLNGDTSNPLDLLTDEENTELMTREEKDAELSKQIEQEETYLSTNLSAYEEAQMDKQFLYEAYVTAASVSNGEMDTTLLPSIEAAYVLGNTPVIPEYYSDSVLDVGVREGQMTRDEATASAREVTTKALADVAELKKVLDVVTRYNVPITDKQLKNLNDRIKAAEENAMAASYIALDGEKDFRTVVDKTVNEVKGSYNPDTKKYDTGKYGYLAEAILDADNNLLALEYETSHPFFGEKRSKADAFNTARLMTQEERDRYMYLLGKEGKEEADKYISLLTNEKNGALAIRNSEKTSQLYRDLASNNGVAATLLTTMSFGTKIIGGISDIVQLVNSKVFGADYKPYSKSRQFTNVTQSIRAGTKELLANAAGDNKALSTILDIGYDAITSAVDSQINAGIMDEVIGLFTSTFNNPFINKLLQGNPVTSSFAHASGMGLEAAASTYNDVYIRTGDDAKASWMALGTFFAETVSEAITYENIKTAFKAGGDEAKSFIKEFFQNGAEEFFGEGISEWIEQNVDKLVMGAESQYALRVAELKDAGYSTTAAERIAREEEWKDILRSGATGFFSSNIGTSANYLRGYVNNRVSNRPDTTPIPGSSGAITRANVNTQNTEGNWERGETPEGFIMPRQETTNEYFGEEGTLRDFGTDTSENLLRSRVTPEVRAQQAANRQLAKETDILVGAYNGDETAAAVAIASVVGTGDSNTSKATGQAMVGNLANGRPKVAIRATQGILNTFRNMQSNGDTTSTDTLKYTLSYAAMTNGKGHQALQRIFNKAARGMTITEENVTDLLNGIKEDRKDNPSAFQKQYLDTLKEFRIANYTVNGMASKEIRVRVKTAEDAVKTSQNNLDNAKRSSKEAHDKVQTVSDNLTAVEDEYNPKDPAQPVNQEAAGEHEQTMNELAGAITDADTADKAVVVQEQKLEKEQKKLDDVRNEAMAEAREVATQQVDQEQAQEAQQAYDNGVATLEPLAPFGHSIEVFDSEGNPVKITGVYDVVYGDQVNLRSSTVQNGNTNYGRQMVGIMYTTEDGRLVMEPAPYQVNGRTVMREGRGTIDTEGNDEAFDAADSLMGNTISGSNDTHPQIRPAVYFTSSFPVNVNGNTIQMIGLAGKTNLDGEVVPVIMGMDGNLYSEADGKFSVPFDYFDDVDELFVNNSGSLDEIDPSRITQTTEGNVNDNQERQENGGTLGLPVQGNVGEGNNEGQLLGPSGRDVGRGDNSNAEYQSEEGEAGRGEESPPRYFGQEEGRRDEVLRNLIKAGLEGSRTATDPGLQRTTDYGLFSSSLEAAKENNPYGSYVASQTPKSLKSSGAITLLSDDGMSGVAVETKGKKKGNIVGLFNNPNSGRKGTLPFLMTHAIANGGNKLDCVDGYLAESFETFGFVPVAKVPNGDSYTIVMAHNGDSPTVVANKYKYLEKEGGYHRLTQEEMDNLPVIEDYKKAIKFRDKYIAKMNRRKGLIVTHNISTENAEAALDQGGFIAPSRAIINTEMGNPQAGIGAADGHGEVVFFFGLDSADPSKNKGVHLFGNDAATPTFPQDKVESRDGKYYLRETGEEISPADVAKLQYEGKGTWYANEVKRYGSLDEAIADRGRIVDNAGLKWGNEEGRSGRFVADFFRVSQEAAKQAETTEGFVVPESSKRSDGSYDINTAKWALIDAAYKAQSDNLTDARQYLSEHGLIVPTEYLDQLDWIFDMHREGPASYFEVKDEGVTGVDQVVAALIPAEAKSLAEKLEANNIPYVTYEKGQSDTAFRSVIDMLERNEDSKTPTDEQGNAVITPPVVEQNETAEQPVPEPPANTPVAEAPANPPVTEAPVNPPANQQTARTIPNGPVRQWNTQGAQETNLLHEEIKQHLLETAVYDPRTNTEDIDNAISWMQSHATEKDPTGFWSAMNEALSDGFNPLSVDGQARTMVLMSMAANNELTDAEQRLADIYYTSRTEVAQALQIGRMFKLMTRDGRKAVLTNEAKKIEQEYRARGKKDLKLNISQEVLDKAANAKSAEDFNEARQQLEKELASQIPSDWRLRMRTFRMAAMLANPRTHIRNLEGNFVFTLPLAIKNAIGVGLERAAGVEVGERTKSIRRSPESIDFAREDAKAMKSELQGTGKLFEVGAVEANRKAFGQGDSLLSRTLGRATQWAADKNGKWLENEDWVSLNRHYINAMASFMTANGYTAKDMTGKVLDKARAYAISEAQKATYRDANKLAKWFSDQSNKPAAAQFIINAVMPFTKTPMNIVKRGVEYSPFGLAYSVATYKRQLEAYKAWEDSGFEGRKPDKAKSPGEVFDRISSGLTGLMLAGLGAFLAGIGVLKVNPPDDEKRKGSQDYSLEIGNASIGIGNMLPTVLPILLGGSVFEEVKRMKGEDDVDLGGVLQALGNMLQPTVETTMMMSWNNLLDTSRYSGDVTTSTLAQKILANYASSFIPSIIGATARVIDPTQRKAYVESGDKMSIWTALREQTENKIPFLSRGNVPYLNAWGEENTSSRFKAFLDNFILPDKIQTLSDSEVDDKLAEITNQTGINVGPTATNSKTITVNGENVKLNDDQWYQYSSSRGKLSKDTLETLIHRPEFITLQPEVQAELVKKVYKYANAKAAVELFPEKVITDGWTKGALASKNVIDYIFEKEEESSKDASNDIHRQSLYQAIQQNNIEAALVDIDALRVGGTEDSSIKSSITRQFKPVYQQALRDDPEEAARIRAFLMMLGLNFNFDSWVN